MVGWERKGLGLGQEFEMKWFGECIPIINPMILIRKLKNPILCRNVVQGLVWPLTTFTGSSVNREMAIEKILKISSNKKCNTPQDAMFCAIIFELLSHNRPTTAKEEADMLKEINRMMSNSLIYIPQLSLSCTPPLT